MFIAEFTRPLHLSLSWARSIQSIPHHSTSWRFILILSSHLRLGLASGLFHLVFPTKTLNEPLLSQYVLLAPSISFFLTSLLECDCIKPMLRHSTLIMTVYKPKYLIWTVPITAVAIGPDLTQFRSNQPPCCPRHSCKDNLLGCHSIFKDNA